MPTSSSCSCCSSGSSSSSGCNPNICGLGCAWEIQITLNWDGTTGADLMLYTWALWPWSQVVWSWNPGDGYIGLQNTPCYNCLPCDCVTEPIGCVPEIIQTYLYDYDCCFYAPTYYSVSNHFKIWYNQYSDCQPEQEPTSCTVTVINVGTCNITINGTINVIPGDDWVSLVTFPYAGYDSGDQSAFTGGLDVLVECACFGTRQPATRDQKVSSLSSLRITDLFSP